MDLNFCGLEKVRGQNKGKNGISIKIKCFKLPSHNLCEIFIFIKNNNLVYLISYYLFVYVDLLECVNSIINNVDTLCISE